MEPISDWTGRLIGGRYEVRECIYLSRMSYVYKAWDIQAQCWVAIKVVANNSWALAYRLKREAEALAYLGRCPHIVRLLGCGAQNCGGQQIEFLVLEFLEGSALDGWIVDKGPLMDQDLCVSIGVAVLEVLAEIHRAGMVHRDIKPENLMVTPRGVVVIDLGTVKFMQQLPSDTLPGDVIGTIGYLSPEQARGEEWLDARSDLYSLTLLLYQLLTGKLPRDKVWLRRSFHGPTHPSFEDGLKAVELSSEMQILLKKGLEDDPSLRYQTAEEMRLALLVVQACSQGRKR